MSGQSNESICTAEELAVAGASGLYCFTRRENVGLVVVAISGFVSLFAVLSIFSLILKNVIRARKSPVHERSNLINKPMDLFMLSLFAGDLFQALGMVLEVKWISDGKVQVGHLCTAQGVMQHLGQAAVAITTIIITLHTFAIVWWHTGVQSLVVAWILVGVLWLFLTLFIAISASIHSTPSFYSPTPYWCWINSRYPDYRIAGENFWLWLAFSVSALYIPLFFWSIGYISPASNVWWGFRIHSKEEVLSERTQRQISVSLIFCALAYCIPVLPTSLARWFLVVHGDVKPFANAEAQFTVKAIFSLGGVCDVLVFRLTRQGLLLFQPRARTPSISPDQSPMTSIPLEFLEATSECTETNVADHRNMTDGIDQVDPSKPRVGMAVSASTMTTRARIGVLVCIWLIINGLDVVWIYFYIRSATNPNPRGGANKAHAGWKGYYVMMYTFGFFLGLGNIVVWLTYFPTAFEWLSGKKGSARLATQYPKIACSKAFRTSGNLLHILIILPVAIIMCLGPFFAPYVGVKIAQDEAWCHRCDSFPVEVILDGRSYDSPMDQKPRASFYFGQSDLRTKYYEYDMIRDENDENVWHLRLGRIEPTVTIPTQLYPFVQDISYRFVNHTLSANCPTSAGTALTDAIEPCMVGSFNEGNFLSFAVNDTRTNTVTNLRAVDKEWAPVPADDAPSFILKEVQPDNSLGAIALRTAVTMRGRCTSLKLCLARETGVDLLAVLGLTLLRQNDYARICTTPNSN